MSNELLTVGEVARLLKVSIRQVWKLKSSGRICPPVHVGRSVRWRAEDIARFIEFGCDMDRLNAESKEVQ